MSQQTEPHRSPVLKMCLASELKGIFSYGYGPLNEVETQIECARGQVTENNI